MGNQHERDWRFSVLPVRFWPSARETLAASTTHADEAAVLKSDLESANERIARLEAKNRTLESQFQQLNARDRFPSLYALRSGAPNSGKNLAIRDAIWGDIHLPPCARNTIDHPAFQRLRRLHQNALMHLVFPGAHHTRFEHSLGVFHVARLMLRSLLASSGDDFPFADDGEVRTVLAACLLHDVGHYQFTHQLEWTSARKRLETRTSKNQVTLRTDKGRSRDVLKERLLWGSKTASLFDVLRDEVDGWSLSEDQANAVVSLVEGVPAASPLSPATGSSAPPPPTPVPLKYTQFINGLIDPDRIDFLLRDAHFTGIGYAGIDFDRIRSTIVYKQPNTRISSKDTGKTNQPPRTVEYRPVLKAKGVAAAEGLLFLRYLLYRHIYNHKAVTSAHQMLRRAVLIALRDELLTAKDVETAHDAVAQTEFGLLGRLASFGQGTESGQLAAALLERRLHKQVVEFGFFGLDETESLEFAEFALELADDPNLLLAVETKLAERLKLKSGAIVIHVPPSKQVENGLLRVEEGALPVESVGGDLIDFSTYAGSILRPLLRRKVIGGNITAQEIVSEVSYLTVRVFVDPAQAIDLKSVASQFTWPFFATVVKGQRS